MTSNDNPKPLRALLLGFCLSVLVAGGAVSASALWSQQATMTLDVTAGTLPPPELQCSKVPNETAVLVSWAPQRAGVTGYDVTVARDSTVIKTASYAPTVTSEKITPPLMGVGEYDYVVRVTAKYGSWAARPAVFDTIHANVAVLGLGFLATISCS